MGGGGGGGMLQRRVEELEASVKKLDEEKATLKQDNASLVSFCSKSFESQYVDYAALSATIGPIKLSNWIYT